MTDGQSATPDKDRIDDDDSFLMTDAGLPVRRVKEIQEAERAGIDLHLSDEERDQYEKSKAQIAELNARLRVTVNEALEPTNKRLKRIIASFPSLVASMNDPKMPFEPVRPPIKISQPVPDIALLDGMAEAADERRLQEESNARNLRDLAEAAQDILVEMDKQDRKNTKRWWWGFGVAVVTLGAAAIAAGPPVIEWLFR